PAQPGAEEDRRADAAPQRPAPRRNAGRGRLVRQAVGPGSRLRTLRLHEPALGLQRAGQARTPGRAGLEQFRPGGPLESVMAGHDGRPWPTFGWAGEAEAGLAVRGPRRVSAALHESASALPVGNPGEDRERYNRLRP